MYKSLDTMINATTKYQVFTGTGTHWGGTFASYTIRDSLKVSRYRNLVGNTPYIPIGISTFYGDDPGAGFENNTPICMNDFSDIQGDSIVTKQLNCYDSDSSTIEYEIDPDYRIVLASNYILPSGTLDIDNTGKLTWVNPPDTGRYLFGIRMRDTGLNGPLPTYESTTWRLITIDVKPYAYTSSRTEQIQNNDLQVFPNPTTNYLTVKFDYFTPKDTYIQVFDMVGRLVYQQQMQRQTEQISLADFSNGLYVVRVQSGNKTWTRKVVKQ